MPYSVHQVRMVRSDLPAINAASLKGHTLRGVERDQGESLVSGHGALLSVRHIGMIGKLGNGGKVGNFDQCR
jgi:hypothetical protein